MAKGRWNRRFNEKEVYEIRDLLRQGCRVKAIAKHMKCHVQIISGIKTGKTYHDIGLHPGEHPAEFIFHPLLDKH